MKYRRRLLIRQRRWNVSFTLLAALLATILFPLSIAPARAAPALPELITATGERTGAALIDGDFAFFGEGRRISVLDLRISPPRRIASIAIPASPDLLELDGDRLYAAGGGQLHVIDVSRRQTPRPLGAPISREICQIDVQGGIAYTVTPVQPAACGEEMHAEIFDLRDLAHPALLSTLAGVRKIIVEGSHAYTLIRPNTQYILQVLDVRDPQAPAFLGNNPLPTFASSTPEFVVSKSNAYVTDNEKLIVYDLSNPARPRQRSAYQCDLPTASFLYKCSIYKIFGNLLYLYIVGTYKDLGHYLGVVDLSDPDHPRLVTNDVGAWIPVSGGTLLAGMGRELLVQDDGLNNHLYLLDLSNPAAPRRIGSYAAPSGGHRFAIEGRRLIVEDRSLSLTFHWPRYFAYLALAEFDFGRAYIPMTNMSWSAMRLGEWSIADIVIENGQVYTCTIEKEASDAGKSGDLDCLALARSGGMSYAVSEHTLSIRETPETITSKLKLIDSGQAPGEALNDIAVSGATAFVSSTATGGGNLRLVDVSNPTAPVLRAALPIAGIESLAASDSIAYLAAGDLVIVDGHDPAHPAIISTLATAGAACDVAVDGSLVYVADREGGLLIVDVSNPRAPQLISETSIPVDQVHISGHRIYAGYTWDGIWLLWYGPTQTTTITSSGGAIEDRAGGVALTFEPGSMPEGSSVSYTPRPIEKLPGEIPLINGDVAFEVTGQQPLAPYTITIHYEAWPFDATAESRLALYGWDGTRWVREPSSSIDTGTNIITARPTTFSLWTIFGEPYRVYLPMS